MISEFTNKKEINGFGNSSQKMYYKYKYHPREREMEAPFESICKDRIKEEEMRM